MDGKSINLHFILKYKGVLDIKLQLQEKFTGYNVEQ